MKIGGSLFQSQISSTPVAREWQQQEVQLQRERDNARRRDAAVETVEADVQISDAARRSARQRQVMAGNGSASAQREPQYYAMPDRSSLSASQQRALQAYSDNQGLGRTFDVDERGEFLGSVDVFV